MLTETDRKILDMLGKHYSYDRISYVTGAKWVYINKLHRKHFPT